MILETNSIHLINLLDAACKWDGNSTRMSLTGAWLLPTL